jgi:WXG100 family type VII secretion target
MDKKRRPKDMMIDTEELEKASKKFLEASKTTEMMIADLEGTMKKIETSWGDTGEQIFFQYYKEWKFHMGGFSEVLATISRDLKAIAGQYSDSDKKILS